MFFSGQFPFEYYFIVHCSASDHGCAASCITVLCVCVCVYIMFVSKQYVIKTNETVDNELHIGGLAGDEFRQTVHHRDVCVCMYMCNLFVNSV